MSARTALRVFGWPAFGALLLGCSSPETVESSDSLEQAANSSYFQDLRLESLNCREVTVLFDRVLTLAGRPVTRFQLLRDAKVVNTVTPTPDRTADVTIRDAWLTPGTGRTHRYHVRVENDQGYHEASAVLEWTAAPCPAPSTSYVLVKYQPSDLPAYPEISADGAILSYFTSNSDARSAKNYFKEVSYNKVSLDVVEYPGWLTLDATHRQLCETKIVSSPSGKKYCASPKASVLNPIKTDVVPEIERAYPGRKVILVLNGVESADSYPQFGAHRFLDSAYDPYSTIYHEIGHHAFHFDEGWELVCPSGNSAFPPSFRQLPTGSADTGCYVLQYGSPHDPMNSVGAHFHATHKLQAGWLTPSDVVIRNSVPLGRDVSYTIRAVDTPSKSSSYKYAVLFRYDDALDGYIALEYRRRVGQNLNVPDLTTGVYVTVFPGVNPTTTTVEADDTSIDFGDVLAPTPVAGRSIVTTTEPFHDHHRSLRVSLTSQTNTDATIKIATCHTAQPSAQCVTSQDGANYRSPGYCCFCGPKAGAWVQKTATTVECSIGATPTR